MLEQPTGIPGPAPYTVSTGPANGEVVATPVLLLVQMPPPIPLLNTVVAFWQNVNTPDIGVGELTVNNVLTPPHTFVAVIVVVPKINPLLTTPVIGLTVATDELLLVHVPVGKPLLLNVVDELRHMVVTPEIIEGAAFTVAVVVAAIPQPVE